MKLSTPPFPAFATRVSRVFPAFMTSAPWRRVKVNDWVPVGGWPLTVLITLASPMTSQLALADFGPIVSLSPYFGSSAAVAFTVLLTVACPANEPFLVTVKVVLFPAARLKVKAR